MNLQEIPTSELVELVRQQADSWQQPEAEIRKELMSRYSWPGCPHEDRILISSLEPILRQLNNGRSPFPVGIIRRPGEAIPPPPAYYRNKVTVSEVLNKTNQLSRPKGQLAKGQHYKEWTLERPLGGGGNGTVWLAQNSQGKSVAIKFLQTEHIGNQRETRFRDEITFLRNESGRPGVLQIIDFYLPTVSTPSDVPWFATPYATCFKDLNLAGGEKLPELVRHIERVARTLAKLHQEGKWHRDLKPENLFILDDVPLLGDFGLVDFPEKDSNTRPSEHLGSRNYTAPELEHNAVHTPADKADVYSLSKTFWVLASGKPPPAGTLRMDTPELRFSAQCPHQRAEHFNWLLENGTRIAPEERPTMEAFARELSEWLKIGDAPSPTVANLSALANECRGVIGMKMSTERGKEEITKQARAASKVFDDTMDLICKQIVEVTGLTPKKAFVNYQNTTGFQQVFQGTPVLSKFSEEIEVVMKMSPFEISFRGCLHFEVLGDKRIHIVAGYTDHPGFPLDSHAPHTWKKEIIAPIGSAQLLNEAESLKAEFLQNLPVAIQHFVGRIRASGPF